ncbi:MAG: hypothetical protein ACREI3_03320, partial [Nitrospirales bacterium]
GLYAMKIRRKTPKASRSGRPHYLIGYQGASPSPSAVQTWFDLEYGGPLRLIPQGGGGGTASEGASAPLLVTHGPWQALVRIALPPEDANTWRTLLEWSHPQTALVVPVTAAPRDAADMVLHAARLARLLTLLTEGTAHDAITQAFLNPSDWTDRRLAQFAVADHIRVRQGDSADPALDWFYSLGLSKFGLDDIEMFQPVGLPDRSLINLMESLAGELVRIGRSPTVGAVLALADEGIQLECVRHRTATPSGSAIPLREFARRP